MTSAIRGNHSSSNGTDKEGNASTKASIKVACSESGVSLGDEVLSGTVCAAPTRSITASRRALPRSGCDADIGDGDETMKTRVLIARRNWRGDRHCGKTFGTLANLSRVMGIRRHA